MQMKFINKRGEVLPLVENPYFYLINVDGQTAATSNLSTLVTSGVDGDEVNNAQAQPRGLVFDLRINNGVDVEEATRAVLRVVKLKQNITVEWTQNDNTLKINGIVESVDMPRWNNKVTMQITLHCEQPFWEDINAFVQEINEAISLHYFTDNDYNMLFFPEEGIPLGEYDYTRTRNFYNNGDVAVGMEIEIVAIDTVTNPIIYGANGAFFGIGYGTGAKKVVLNSGDIIRINTKKGEKSVTLNNTTSLFSKIKPQSTWLQLSTGENEFSISSDDESVENMTFFLSYRQRYI